MRVSAIHLVAICLLLLGHGRARDVKVFANDPRLIFGFGWQFIPQVCGGEGFAQTPTNGTIVSFVFTGTAVSVSLLRVYNSALAAVYLDGDLLMGNIDLVDSLATNAQCHRQLVNSTTLANTNHNLTILHAGRTRTATAQNGDWLVLIDITYTTTDETSSSSSVQPTIPVSTPTTNPTSRPINTQTTSSAPNMPSTSPIPATSSPNTPAIVGGIVAGVLGGLILGLAISWYFFRKRQRRHETSNPISTPPFHYGNPHPQTMVYAHPPASYPYATGGVPWAPYNLNETTPTEMPSSDEPRTSMTSSSNINRDFPQPPRGSRPLLSKPGSSGWNPSRSVLAVDSISTPRNATPPPPQYEPRGHGPP